MNSPLNVYSQHSNFIKPLQAHTQLIDMGENPFVLLFSFLGISLTIYKKLHVEVQSNQSKMSLQLFSVAIPITKMVISNLYWFMKLQYMLLDNAQPINFL